MTLRPTRSQTWLARVLLMLLAMLVAFLSAESAARALPDTGRYQERGEPDDALWADPAWRSPPEHVYRPDRELGYTHAANAIADVKVAEHPDRACRLRTNGDGLRRDSEIAVPKPPGTYRVLVLGDSQTSGYTANADAYPGQLEARWAERAAGRTVEVLNAGIDGYGPQQVYLWYLRYGLPLEADLVIFAVYAGNDVDDLAHGAVSGATIDDDAGRIGPLRTPLAWLKLRSELVQRVRPPVQRVLDEVQPARTVIPEDRLIRLLRECHGCWLQSLKQAVRARTEPDAAERAYRRLELAFQLVESLAGTDGGRLAVVTIPTKIQVEPDDERGAVGRAGRLLELDPADAVYDTMAYNRIREAAQRAGVLVVDPLAALQEQAQDRRLYYRRDWHLNPAGNRALATALDIALTDAGVGP